MAHLHPQGWSATDLKLGKYNIFKIQGFPKLSPPVLLQRYLHCDRHRGSHSTIWLLWIRFFLKLLQNQVRPWRFNRLGHLQYRTFCSIWVLSRESDRWNKKIFLKNNKKNLTHSPPGHSWARLSSSWLSQGPSCSTPIGLCIPEPNPHKSSQAHSPWLRWTTRCHRAPRRNIYTKLHIKIRCGYEVVSSLRESCSTHAAFFTLKPQQKGSTSGYTCSTSGYNYTRTRGSKII